jgi:mRNA interferase HicA
MKRRDLIRTLEQMGCVLVRNGGRHDCYTNEKIKQSQPVPPKFRVKR